MTTKQVIRDKKISILRVWKQSKSWIYQSSTAFISDPLKYAGLILLQGTEWEMGVIAYVWQEGVGM